ncbi:MAG: tetratricopeptide repeat protein [Coriobacteriia bacterium]|nr:tetratricopeptide repeat protein [Coriobacteriia bacterium]
MNSLHFEHARAAYDKGEYVEALKEYYACLKTDSASFGPGDAGLVFYRLGNCLLKMRSFQEATVAYAKALEDAAFSDKTAVRVNLGKSQIGLGDYEGAITSFSAVLSDPHYQKPYQAHMGLGTAFSRLGMTVDAGTAFRNAALDERNPNPIKALMQLGTCFIVLGRPQDSIESYKAIFEFEPEGSVRSKANEALGQAYTAIGRYQDAVDAFTSAVAEGRYALTKEAMLDYEKAQDALEASYSKAQSSTDSSYYAFETEEEYASADEYASEDAYGAAGDDGASDDYYTNTSSSGSSRARGGSGPRYSYMNEEEGYGGGNVPAAYDTGFFTATDDDLIAMGKRQLRKERKQRHIGLKILLVFMILLVLALGAGVYAYWQGYGYPTQEMVINDLFTAHAQGEDVLQYWASGESNAKVIGQKMSTVAKTADIEITYFETTMTNTEVMVIAHLSKGGTLWYEISLERSFLGWEISDITLIFASQQ